MKRIILLTASLLFVLFVNAQIVNIPDTNFKSALVNDTLINTNQDTEIQVSEASIYTGAIDISFKNISDLTGIEAFTALTNLNCMQNQLTMINLSNNIALTDFYCSANQLTSIDISNNIVLENFGCDHNQLNTIDVSNNTALEFLSCTETQIDTLDLSNNIELINLYFSNNQINDIDLSNNINLMSLQCNHCQLTNLDVSNNIALSSLLCHYNQLNKLDISNNIALEGLACFYNQIDTLDLSNNIELINLQCHNNILLSLNVKNGNNINFYQFIAYNNPDLFCIEVDDDVWSTANWTDIDPQSYFSEDCTTDLQFKLQKELKLAPNPFNENLTISLDNNVDEVDVSLFNVLGKQIEVSYEKQNNEIIINGASLNPGIYFVEIRDKNKLIGKSKVIKL